MKNSFLFIILLQFFSILLISSKAQPQSSLNKGSSQLVEHYDQPFLVSQDGTFACGFYPDPVGVNVFYFSIWLTNSIEKTVAWTANRDSPVNGHGSKIKFGRDGNLFLRDFNGSEVWSTSTGGSSASTISLHDSGNLVINDRKVSWEALPELCQVHGLCGENGICDYLGDQMRCSCLPGYEMKNPNNWNEGCRPKFTYSCNKIQSRFVQIPQVDFYGFDLAYKEKISYDDCEQLCLQNCTCTGFSYRLTGAGFCYPKEIEMYLNQSRKDIR
ncbi:Serine/threonine-protein kinase [Rhynchospora pubera]|uniref:non-specific serine/threonine protein kinase n=1 Tax=Rhynchospora pubera TaxID=906938 RepID=A0AAV8C405_9POAL|nr:Serine/threonine-protein kinase [Rhynchospora pubera]